MLSSKQSTKDLAQTWVNYMVNMTDLVYGDAFRIWYESKGKEDFYKWAKEQGLEFVTTDFEIFKKGFILSEENNDG